MKRLGMIAAAALLLPLAASAQDAAPVANPVTSTVKAQLGRYAKNMVGAATLMPPDKYGFKPTPEMMTFGHLVMHIAQSNGTLCSRISGTTAPDTKDLKDTDPKDKLVAALQASFEFCSTALANVDDSKLGEPVPGFGGRTMPRAAAILALSDDWYDHYSQQAVYLRLNGILPPTAQPRPAQ